MGRKIFISYKYGDTCVYPLSRVGFWATTTARDYVTELQDRIDLYDHINKGELDGETLANFKDSTIESKLRDRIYDSSISLVLISKNMKDRYLAENDQWIPWEISYSLKEHARNGRTSRTNALLAVVLPDENNSYDYCLTTNTCCSSGCTSYKTPSLFKILRDNMFNLKHPSTYTCKMPSGGTIFTGEHSYIKSVKWCDFILDLNHYLEQAYAIQNNIDSYNITKLP